MPAMMYVVRSCEPDPIHMGAFDSREEAKEYLAVLCNSWIEMLSFDYVEVPYFASLAEAVGELKACD